MADHFQFILAKKQGSKATAFGCFVENFNLILHHRLSFYTFACLNIQFFK
ncbi:hypothetical protein F383_13550 [Gossypium arboreum]|uniref:Uncharacterized protein n=1 Tax=Gossypium arboreum TaxID=29729 RepID=A0A0B0NCV9_GOSAR|nr:hypothetical protein F383_13550 [Gossypium arboreum]